MQIAVPLLFLMAATSHSSSVPGPSTPVSPASPLKIRTACAAVTKADIEAALGRPVSPGVESKGDAQSGCDYDGGEGSVTIALIHSNDKLDIDAEIADLKKLLPQGVVRNATGLSARAFFVDIPNAGAQLHVLRTDHDFLMVSVLGFGGPAQVSDAILTLARKALDRL